MRGQDTRAARDSPDEAYTPRHRRLRVRLHVAHALQNLSCCLFPLVVGARRASRHRSIVGVGCLLQLSLVPPHWRALARRSELMHNDHMHYTRA